MLLLRSERGYHKGVKGGMYATSYQCGVEKRLSQVARPMESRCQKVIRFSLWRNEKAAVASID